MLILTKIVLGPLLLAQGRWLRKTALRLPEAAGLRQGVECPLQVGTHPEDEPIRVLVVGDSSAAGVGVADQAQALAQPLAVHLAQQAGRPVAWQLVAQSGVNSREVLDLLPQQEINPATVLVVALGTNDVTSQLSPQTYVANLQHLVQRLAQQAGVAQVVLAGLPPLHTLPCVPQPLRWYLGRCARKLDHALRTWIAQDPALRYCSLQWAQPEGLAVDRFHPGADQYARWARMSADIIDAEFMRRSPVQG